MISLARKVEKKKDKVIVYLLLVLTYRVFLDIMYSHVVTRYFGYSGFLKQPSIEMALLAGFLLVAFSLICKPYYFEKGCLSDEIMFFLFLISVVPFTTMIAYGQFSKIFILANTVYWCCMFGIQRLLKHVRLPKVKLKISRYRVFGEKKCKLLAIGLILVVMYISGRYAGFRLNFNLYDVYELRADAASFELPTILSYAFSWAKAIVPILLAYFIIRKKIGWSILCIITQLLSFGVDGLKSTLLMLVCVLVISYIPNKIAQKLNSWMLVALAMVSGVVLILYFVWDNYDVINIIYRRALFAPNQLSEYYFDFFANNEPDYFRGSFLRHFGFETPYEETFGKIIGRVYFNKPSMNCNNGLMADSVTNMGVIGIVIMPFIWGVTFKILDMSTEGLDRRIYTSVAFVVSYLMISTFYFTIMLTYGLLIIIILLSFIEREYTQKKTDG